MPTELNAPCKGEINAVVSDFLCVCARVCCHIFPKHGIKAHRSHNNNIIPSEQGFTFLTQHLACFRKQPSFWFSVTSKQIGSICLRHGCFFLRRCVVRCDALWNAAFQTFFFWRYKTKLPPKALVCQKFYRRCTFICTLPSTTSFALCLWCIPFWKTSRLAEYSRRPSVSEREQRDRTCRIRGLRGITLGVLNAVNLSPPAQI